MCSYIFRLFPSPATIRVCSCRTLNLFISKRGKKYFQSKIDKELYQRRLVIGPEKLRHRSVWPNWNYDAEVFAFGKRLGEEFQESTLKEVFTDRSFVNIQKQAAKELDLEMPSFPTTNEQLAEEGLSIAKSYIKAYLRHELSRFPEEGVCALCDYLLSDAVMGYIGANLGFKDLILCQDVPPLNSTYATAFAALIGGLRRDQGDERAQLLVQDLIITMLIGKDINELWKIDDPMTLLCKILASQGLAAPEARLIGQLGATTALAAFQVGIYCEKKMIGFSFGETMMIAEEMAARDCLKRIFRTGFDRPNFKFGKNGRNIKLDFRRINPSVNDDKALKFFTVL